MPTAGLRRALAGEQSVHAPRSARLPVHVAPLNQDVTVPCVPPRGIAAARPGVAVNDARSCCLDTRCM